MHQNRGRRLRADFGIGICFFLSEISFRYTRFREGEIPSKAAVDFVGRQ